MGGRTLTAAAALAPSDAAPAPEPSKAQRALEHIRARIADGTYPPGYRLVLGQIARELDVSPVPVREAVRMLEAEGAVTFARNVGAQVAILDPELYADTMETLALVEGFATAKAAPRITPAELADARRVNREMKLAVDAFDPGRFTMLNEQFHRRLVGPCRNEHVAELAERGWTRLRSLRGESLGFVPGRAASAIDEHARILDLIEEGAAAGDIERAAREHRLATLAAFRARGVRPATEPIPVLGQPIGPVDLTHPTPIPAESEGNLA